MPITHLHTQSAREPKENALLADAVCRHHNQRVRTQSAFYLLSAAEAAASEDLAVPSASIIVVPLASFIAELLASVAWAWAAAWSKGGSGGGNNASLLAGSTAYHGGMAVHTAGCNAGAGGGATVAAVTAAGAATVAARHAPTSFEFQGDGRARCAP